MNHAADKRLSETLRGVLYVVGTPIGNLEDITLRAIRTLGEVDLVAAEDTRKTRRLLTHHGIDRPLVSLHEHNEERRAAELISKLDQGTAIALVSDAGTPTLSDPGYRLVKDVLDAGIHVVPIPGPSAGVAALSVSGLPTDAFLFLGFPPRKRAKRRKFLLQAAGERPTLVFYESPKRVADLLADLKDVMGERRAVLSREMTKTYEEFIRGTLNDIIAEIQRRKEIKGECTLLVEGAHLDEGLSPEALTAIVAREISRGESGAAALSRQIAERYCIPKKRVYAEILKFKESKQ